MRAGIPDVRYPPLRAAAFTGEVLRQRDAVTAVGAPRHRDVEATFRIVGAVLDDPRDRV